MSMNKTFIDTLQTNKSFEFINTHFLFRAFYAGNSAVDTDTSLTILSISMF